VANIATIPSISLSKIISLFKKHVEEFLVNTAKFIHSGACNVNDL
jgi:hypothetical protein